MSFIGSLISWIIIGSIIGLIARALMPGKQKIGFFATAILGVAGAIMGGLITGLFGGNGVSGIMNNPWSFGTIALAVVGAILVMVIVGFITRNSNK